MALCAEKIISALKAALRSLAEAKHRPPALAEAISDKDLKVFHVRNLKTGQETYISDMTSRSARRRVEKAGRSCRLRRQPLHGTDGQSSCRSRLGRRAHRQPRRTEKTLRAERTYGHGTDRYRRHRRVSQLVADHRLASDCRIDRALHGGDGARPRCRRRHRRGLLPAPVLEPLPRRHRGLARVMLFVVGVACIGVEIFVLPGTIVPGLVGAAVIVVSLVMATPGLPDSGNSRPTSDAGRHDEHDRGLLRRIYCSGGSAHAADGFAALAEPPDAGSARLRIGNGENGGDGQRGCASGRRRGRCHTPFGPAARAALANARSTSSPAAIFSIAARRSAWFA